MSATSLMVVYSLNTWLPELMLRAGFNAKGSLSFLLVLNGGAVIGSLLGSKVADRFGPKIVVASCFGIGALSIAALTINFPLAILLAIVAIVGLGTSGTQTLLYGFVANYYRTNVRSAGVAWCAGFGRIGGVGGPMLGGFLAGGGFALETIFFVLAGLATLGVVLTSLVPKSKAEMTLNPTFVTPPQSGETNPESMYRRILVAFDAAHAANHGFTVKRIKALGKMAQGSVHVLYIQNAHIVPGSIMAGAGLGVRSAGEDVEPLDKQMVQSVVNELSNAGVDAHGEMVGATEHDVASVILQRAQELNIDLLVLENEYHTDAGHGLRPSVAEQVIRQHPNMSILMARPPAYA